MLGIDLHLHTFDKHKEPKKIDFDIDLLKEYVEEYNLKVIAITNHDFFGKEQFENIKNSFNDVLVLPGCEISLNIGHLLVIFNPEKIDYFEETINKIEKIINKSNNEQIKIEEFKESFKKIDKNDYFFIADYSKNNAIKRENIEKLGDIKFFEVSNVKKFIRFEKDSENFDFAKPFIFSDNRINKKSKVKDLKAKFTYLNCEFKNINSFSLFKKYIETKDVKTYHSPLAQNQKDLFLPKSKTFISLKSNLILGKRNSGKTFLLDEINNYFDDENKVNYIKQFIIQKEAEKIDSKKSENSLIKKEETSYREKFENKILIPLENLTKKIIDRKIKSHQFESYIDEYLESLKEFSKNPNKNSWTKLNLFNSDILDKSFLNKEIKKIKKIYENICWLENKKEEEYSNLNKLIPNFKKELKILIRKKIIKEKIIDLTNDLLKVIKEKIKEKSSIKPIKSLNFQEIFILYTLKNKINSFFKRIKENAKKYSKKEEIFNKFIKEVNNINFFENVTNFNKYFPKSEKVSSFFKKYKDCKYYEFIEKLNEERILNSNGDLFKTIIYPKINFYNLDGSNLSGGQKAELFLLLKINNNNKDIILIDEPEGSFDNKFILENLSPLLNNLIRDDKLVVISTHNNVLANAFEENKIIINKNRERFYSDDDSKRNFVKYENNVENNVENFAYKEILELLEAGKESYDERKKNYENLKMRE